MPNLFDLMRLLRSDGIPGNAQRYARLLRDGRSGNARAFERRSRARLARPDPEALPIQPPYFPTPNPDPPTSFPTPVNPGDDLYRY